MFEFIHVTKVDQITTITLHRPEKRNAMHGPLIQEVTRALQAARENDTRILILNGAGDYFCAGGDIAWMQQIATATEAENIADAESLAMMLQQLYDFPHPTIVLAQGAAMGGGFGLVAAADIAIAAKSTQFGLPEVKMGITPSIISPYVIKALGPRQSHYYFLTGERFDAETAYRLGLVHHVVEAAELHTVGMTLAKSLLKNGPGAMQAAKELIRTVAGKPIERGLSQQTARHLAHRRRTPEAQEGLRAFIEKREAKF